MSYRPELARCAYLEKRRNEEESLIPIFRGVLTRCAAAEAQGKQDLIDVSETQQKFRFRLSVVKFHTALPTMSTVSERASELQGQ